MDSNKKHLEKENKMNKKISITIIVATHKKATMPNDPMYMPLHVGAEGKFNPDGTPLDFGYAKDNVGENISAENYCFGTQTALYWAWKHVTSDYIGLVHYRRYFLSRKPKKNEESIKCILSEKELSTLVKKYKVFVPKRRNYYVTTIYSHYAKTFDGTHFDIARQVISEKSPEYLKAFDSVMNRTYGYMFNLMILRRDLLNSYCTWLFDILFEIKNRIDMTNLSDFEKRFAGRISERLFNVWLEQQLLAGVIKKEEIKELPYAEEVNWKKKISSFISAMVFGKKYTQST